MKLISGIRKIFSNKTYDLPVFSQQTTFIKQASSALLEMSKTTDPVVWRRMEKEVKACEVQADALLPDFYEDLYKYVCSNSERADIQSLATRIDDFLDNINTSAKSFLLYGPERIDNQISDLVQFIFDEADALHCIMLLMRESKTNYSAISLQCDRITELEHAADEAYEDYIGWIFKNEKNAIELMKYKNIAEVLESTTDVGKQISDLVRKMILRYV